MDDALIAPATAADEEETAVTIDDEEESEPLRVMADPGQPTAEQLELHRLTHWPYRAWCKWCVMGRGRGAPHTTASACTIPIIGLDYFFITVGGVEKRSDLKEFSEDAEGNEALEQARQSGKIVKCLLMRDSKSKALFAHVVPCKGVDEERYVVDLVVSDLEWLGHTAMLLKADNERSLQALVRAVMRKAHASCKNIEQLSKEEPAAYDSQSNGLTEIGVQLVRGHFRTMKLCVEARIGKAIPVGHALISWLMLHVCVVLNATVRGPDGLTAWARCRGRAFGQKLLNFGEAVLYKLPVKGPMSAPDGNMGTKWREGTFLGHSKSTNAYVVGTESGIKTSRSLMRRPESDRWQGDKLAQLTATPWSERVRPERTVTFRDPADQGAPAVVAPPVPLRAMRLNQADFDKYGYTDGCRQCTHMQEDGRARPGIAHSDACRKRVIEAIAQTEAGKRRIAEYDDRLNKSMAEAIARAHPARRSPSPATAALRRRHDVPGGAGAEAAPRDGGVAARAAAGRAPLQSAPPRRGPAREPPERPRGEGGDHQDSADMLGLLLHDRGRQESKH